MRLTLVLLLAMSAGCALFHKTDDAAGASSDDTSGGSGSGSAPGDPTPATPNFGNGPTPPATVWGVDTGNELVSFAVEAPGTVLARALTGLAPGEHVVGIDFRPADKKLYALGDQSHLYVVDTDAATATATGGSMLMTLVEGESFGFDFDPLADVIRVQSTYEQNLRVDPTAGTVSVDAPIAYAAGDVNLYQAPAVVGTAFTATGSLFAIDATRHLLLAFDDPSRGQVKTMGRLAPSFDATAGFDIAGPLALAALHVDGETHLYRIDLTNGGSADLGRIDVDTGLVGISIEP